MRLGRDTVRGLAWAALAGQVAFVASWIVAGALEPGYSHLREGVSALGAKDALHPWIVNTGIVVLGASVAALGMGVARVLPRRPARAVAPLLFVGAGACIALCGVFQTDCSFASHHCRDLWDAGRLSGRTDAHVWLSLVSEVLFALTPFALARALWPSPAGAASLWAGCNGIAIFVLAFFLEGSGSGPAGGLVQRLGLGVFHLWVLIVAVGVLHATRRAPEPGRLVPLRPRDFFAQAWRGEGEIVPWPPFLGRLLTQRFAVKRDSIWLSDTLFRLEDEARYPDGRIERQHTYCEFVAEDRVRLSGGHLPDGAYVQIEEDGYRTTPFRAAYALGPIPLLFRCHDVSTVEPDGALVNEFDVRAVGVPLPVARLRFRVRPVDPDAAGGAEGYRSPALRR